MSKSKRVVQPVLIVKQNIRVSAVGPQEYAPLVFPLVSYISIQPSSKALRALAVMTAKGLQGLQNQLACFIKRGDAFGVVCHGHIHIVHFHAVKSQGTLAQGQHTYAYRAERRVRRL